MCNHRSFAETLSIRRGYHHSYAISKSRAGVSAGLGGFVGFRQLPRWPGECDRFANIAWPSGNERPTGVTAKNLRSRRPSFWPAPEAIAPLARNREWGSEGVPFTRSSLVLAGHNLNILYAADGGHRLIIVCHQEVSLAHTPSPFIVHFFRAFNTE
jgi:hypothetical protein